MALAVNCQVRFAERQLTGRSHLEVELPAAGHAHMIFSAYLQQKGLDARKQIVYCYAYQGNVDAMHRHLNLMDHPVAR
jgi:hypothetical protein